MVNFMVDIKRILEAIVTQGDQPSGIDFTNFKNGLVAFHGEGGVPIYKYTHHEYTIFSFGDMSYVIGIPFQSKGKPGLRIARSYTPPEHQRMGYATALYYALVANRWIIASDSMITDKALRIWQSLTKRCNVSVYNVTTHEMSNTTNASDVNDGNEQTILIAEGYEPITGGIFEGTMIPTYHPLLTPNVFFTLTPGEYE